MLASESTKQGLLDYMKSHALRVGDKLPSEAKLSKQLKVSRLTLREAVSVLKNEGIVYSVQGKGTFLTSEPGMMEDSLNHNSSITEMIEARGLKAGVKFAARELVTVDAELSDKLGIKEGESIVRWRRIRTAEGKPVVYSEDYLSPTIVKAFLTITDDNKSLYKVIEEELGIEMGVANTDIAPAKADAELATMLDMKEGDLLMEFRVLVHDLKGEPMIYAHEYLKPDSFKFVVNRWRNQTQ
jgi:GntR family transcriptional regulator